MLFNLEKFNFSQILQNQQEKIFENTKDIKIDSFNISIKNKKLFNNANLVISHGRKYGFVGQNGAGKSTLLKHLAVRIFKIPENIDLLLCEQEILADETSAINYVLNSDIKRKELLDLEEKLLKSELDIDVEQLNQVQQEMAILNIDSAKSKAQKILFGLGFDKISMNKPIKDFSGGWQMRISLARALFIEPTLLMLDEPTNHLDLDAVIWLEDYLINWKKTLIIVSHNQSFLDNICTDIMFLDMEKLFYFKGNYSLFKKMLIQKRREQLKAYEKQEKEIREAKISGKSKTEAENKQLKKRPVNIDKNKELLKKPNEYIVKFKFYEPDDYNSSFRIGLENVSFKYNKDFPIFEKINFGIDAESRIVILGQNGIGKSTLLKLLLKELEHTEGEYYTSRFLRVAKYNQHSANQFDLNISPVQYLQKTYNMNYQECRKQLGTIGLAPNTHETQINNLSGGQKARLALCDLVCKKPDIMILDEPTNNLDIESIDALIKAINEYKGGVVVVTHDEHFIKETNCSLYIVYDKKVIKFNGDFNKYKKMIISNYN